MLLGRQLVIGLKSLVAYALLDFEAPRLGCCRNLASWAILESKPVGGCGMNSWSEGPISILARIRRQSSEADGGSNFWAALNRDVADLAAALSLPTLSLFAVDAFSIEPGVEVRTRYLVGLTGALLQGLVRGRDFAREGRRLEPESITSDSSFRLLCSAEAAANLSLGQAVKVACAELQQLCHAGDSPVLSLAAVPSQDGQEKTGGLLIPVTVTLTNASRLRTQRVCGLLLLGFSSSHPSKDEQLYCEETGYLLASLLSRPMLSLLSTRFQEDSAASPELSRRLSAEQWLRQSICAVHSSLDRDFVMQTLADSLGRGLKPSRCLVVRTAGGAAQVLHEWEDPDFSPLGLGRTSQFPLFACELLERLSAYSDLSLLKQEGRLSEDEYDMLSFDGIESMVGLPLFQGSSSFGVIALVSSKKRHWSDLEMECLDTLTKQASIALGHCLEFQSVRDQLFHAGLMSNLTGQLISALESVSGNQRSLRPLPEEKSSESPEANLSARELEVLRLISSGYANREIAQRLFLTESTVELHASRIRKKLKLKSRTALVKYACDKGIV